MITITGSMLFDFFGALMMKRERTKNTATMDITRPPMVPAASECQKVSPMRNGINSSTVDSTVSRMKAAKPPVALSVSAMVYNSYFY